MEEVGEGFAEVWWLLAQHIIDHEQCRTESIRYGTDAPVSMLELERGNAFFFPGKTVKWP